MKPPCARSAPASQVRRRRASGQEGGEAGRVQARWHTSRERQQAGRADGQDACVGGGHGPVRRTGLGVGGGRQGGRRDKSRARRWASPRRPRSGEERRRAAGAPAGRGCSQTRQSSPCSCPGCCPSRASTRRGSPAASRLAGPPGFAAARPPGPVSTDGALQQPRSILTMHPLLQLDSSSSGCTPLMLKRSLLLINCHHNWKDLWWGAAVRECPVRMLLARHD